jgi:ferritin-like metal-binding protein YciE
MYMRALRHIYDTEKQLYVSLPALRTPSLDKRLAELLMEIADLSESQSGRLEEVFAVLYETPRGEASWVTTALLREAWEVASVQESGAGTQGCAAALLAVKRYELTLYEMLLRWSEQCGLDEVLPPLRRCVAEELLHAAILFRFAVEATPDIDTPVTTVDRRALH